MDPAQLKRFREIEEGFYAAMEEPAGSARDEAIRRLAGDEEFRAEVAALAENHDRIQAAAPCPAERLPRFGAWQSVKLLGRGGMGTVYLAERADGAFQMQAAVKAVALALASPEIEERFRRERQFLASLDHPKIARLIDGGVSETGLPYLVMEFVQGQTIDRYCQANALDARASAALVRQVLEALAYVHGRNVLHRDIKPSNILADQAGNVKLLDFGTARLADATAEGALTKTGVFALTPDYASPEQARGGPMTFASDLYSVGVLLHRLVTGSLPGRPAEARVDPPLDEILAKALDRNPAARYQSAREMDADLTRYLEGRRVRGRWLPWRRRRWLWAAAAVLLCVAAVLAWYHFRGIATNQRAAASFQLGQYHWARRTRDSLLKAVDAFGESTTADPNFAPAYAYLADTYAILPEYGENIDPRWAEKGKRAARRAIELDPKLSIAHGALAWIAFSSDWNWSVAEPEFRSSIALAPKQALPHQRYGLALASRGRFTEAESELNQAQQIEPLSLNAMINRAELWYYARRFDREEEQLHRAIELDPNYVVAYAMLTELATLAGRPAEAIALAQKLRSMPEGGNWCQHLAQAYARAGDRGAALREIAACGSQPVYAGTYIYLGDYDRAIDQLEARFARHDPWLPYLNVDAAYDALHGQPRFEQLLRKLGF